MATNAQKQQPNYLEQYIAIAKERCDKARQKSYCRLTVEYFENMAIVMVQLADRIQVACFLEEHDNSYWPVFTYWLTREQRLPLVARMYRQGISGVKIAQFLKLAPATIYRDLSIVREKTPSRVEKQIDLSRGAQRASRILDDGDFKIAGLNFRAQVLDLKSNFLVQ